MKQILPKDATFRHLSGPAKQREEYLRRVVENLDGSGPYREQIAVRIGVAGQGIKPHYKFESDVDFQSQELGITGSWSEAFIVYNGSNHKRMTAFELADVRDEHWSAKPMSYAEVKTIFGEVRAERKAG